MTPGHARDADGTLTIGGVRADALAERCGTPALIFDCAVFETALDAFLQAARETGVGISYASKAFFITPLARRLAARPVGIDVSSIGELSTAERGGIASARITLHGAGKTDEELEAACGGRVGRLVVDSLDELHRLVRVARGRPLRILLRINTGIEAHTHAFVRTAGDDTKFGIPPRDEAGVFELLRVHPHLRVDGVHSHIGSQIYGIEPFVENVRALAATLARVRAEIAPQAATLVCGGGFGVQMHPERAEAIVAPADVLRALVEHAPQGTHVEVEPGRAIVAAAGTSLYRVMAVKRYERRTFVIVDGSMADNPRPALYGAYHHVVPVRASDAPNHPVTVCGRSCENDELAEVALPADLRAGDLVAFCTTGAYTYAMSSNYNRFPRPPVVAIAHRETQVWARRERDDDVLRLDEPA